jgi:hypothetical protein
MSLLEDKAIDRSIDESRYLSEVIIQVKHYRHRKRAITLEKKQEKQK